MKKTILFAAMAALLTIASCRKEDVPSQDSTKDPVFTATIENSATKTTVDAANNKVAWVLNDEITVTDNSSVSVKYEVTAIDGSGTATFTKKSGESGTLGSGPYTAIYGSAPSKSQTYSASAPSLPMSGASGVSDTNLKFTVTCGLLEITLTKSGENIKSISVSDDASTPNTYTLDCGAGVSIASGAKFFIAVPAGTYTAMAITDTGDNVCDKIGLSLAVAANHIKPVSSTKLEFYYPAPDGALKGLFTVDASGTKVRFAKGNLQYLGTGDSGTETPQWRFAEHQYDFMGNGSSSCNVYISGYSTYNASTTADDEKAARDLFGWGTTGYKDTRNTTDYQINIQPYSTSTSEVTGASSINKYGYGPDYDSKKLYGLTVASKSDWGYCMGGESSPWRTLSGGSGGEWNYLLNTRSSSAKVGKETNARYAKVKVNDIYGLLIFPDVFNWTTNMGTAPTCNIQNAPWPDNSFSSKQFSEMESAGCVFLPLTNRRNGISVIVEQGQKGFYWSSTVSSAINAFALSISTGLNTATSGVSRSNGYSVRLVTVAQK